MFSRLLDAQGMPRERALWLVMASVVTSQLLAFWIVCHQQVERAAVRHAQVRQLPVQDCGATADRVCTAQAAGSVQMSDASR